MSIAFRISCCLCRHRRCGHAGGGDGAVPVERAPVGRLQRGDRSCRGRSAPGGDRLVLPFTSHFKSEPVDCSTSSTLELDTSIMFDVDDALRAYAETGGPEPEADGRIQVGYIYATVRFESFLHPGYASVECWAATSGMSRLFARSTNIRKVFTDLAAASGGVCCLFDTGDGGPEQVCWLNGETTQEMVPGPRFPDRRALVASWSDPER